MGCLIGWVLWMTAAGSPAGDLPKGQVIEKVTCLENPQKSYALYVPSSYDPSRPAPVLLLFEPASRAALPLRFFKEAAEAWGFIVTCSYDTPNYTPWEENRVGVEAMWNDVLQRFRVDSRRMYVGGLSGGARLASRVAFVTEQVAGLVSCGAGFWERDSNAPPPRFDVVTTVGTRDFNYLELLDLEKALARSKVPNRRILFEGGHLWPGSEDCFEILAWLQLQAFRKGLIPEEQLRVGDQLAQRLAVARRLEEKDPGFLAALRYQQLIDDFEGLADTSELSQRRDALLARDQYKQGLKQEKRALQLERKQQRALLSRLKSGERLAGRDPLGLNAEYAWWKKQAGMLVEDMEDATNPFAARAAHRLVSVLQANIYETSVYLVRERQFPKLLFLNKVGVQISPKSPAPFYNQAIACAGLDDFDRALNLLETSINNGYRDVARIRADPDLVALSADPRFDALLSRYEKKE